MASFGGRSFFGGGWIPRVRPQGFHSLRISARGTFQGNNWGRVHRLHNSQQAGHMATRASAQNSASIVTDPATGVDFPAQMKFWDSVLFDCLGAGVRKKRIAGAIAVKVYAIGIYAEANKAASELVSKAGDLAAGGESAYCDAIRNGNFDKVMQLELVRDVAGDTFSKAIKDALEKEMKKAGEEDKLRQFEEFFAGQKLKKGANVVLRLRTNGMVEVAVAESQVAWGSVAPGLKISSDALVSGFLDLYLGKNSVTPGAREAVAKAAEMLTTKGE